MKEEIIEFINEVTTEVGNIENVLLGMEETQNLDNDLNAVFRFLHNVKGVSGMFGWVQLQEVFHLAEDILVHFRNQKARLTSECIELCLQTIDYFKESSAYFKEQGDFPPKKPYSLLHLLDKFGNEIKGIKDLGQTSQVKDDKAAAGGKKEKDESIRISGQQAEELMEVVSSFIQLQNKLDVGLIDSSDSFALKSDIQRFSSSLQKFALSIRLSPLQPLLSSLGRIVNSASKDLGKKINLRISGGETQLDRRVLDLLRDPLIHMIRNSVDHGIEKPEERISSSKSATGTITIEAYQQAGQVVIVINDDGRGIDHQKLLKKALEKGVLTEAQAAQMGTKEILNLIFHPGFSTAESISNLSGRGVGMDTVKTSIESVGGSVLFETEVGTGTVFKLILPMTLAIVKSLTFSVEKQVYAIPQLNVEEVVTADMLKSSNELEMLDDGNFVIKRRKQVIPVVDLNKIFGSKQTSEKGTYIIVRHRSSHFSLKVDEIHGTRDFVSQPCPPMFEKIDIISGVNQLNSGEYIGLIDLAVVEELVDLKGQLTKAASAHDNKEEGLTNSDIFRSQQKMVFFRSGRNFCVAVQNIKEVFNIHKSQLERLNETAFITHNGKTYPVVRCYTFFAQKEFIEQQDNYTILLVHRDEHQAAIVCEDFYGIHRLPGEFDDMVRDDGILGTTNLKGETYLVPDIRRLFELEFPDKYKSHGPHRKSKYTVMIVEDDKFFAANLSNYLKSHGFNYICCLDGLVAQETIKKLYFENIPITLDDGTEVNEINYVITDFEMPRMNGIELLKWVRRTEEIKNLPVSMCTAVGDNSTMEEAKKLGVDFFAGKMKYDLFINHIINHKRQNDLGIDHVESMATIEECEEKKELNKRILVFAVGEKLYGIDIIDLKEISTIKVSTTIPGMPHYASKIVPFRGNPIPVIDLRIIQNNLKNIPNEKEVQQIIAEFSGNICSLWVDKVYNVRRLEYMDKSKGINQRSFGTLSALTGSVVWDNEKDECIALLQNEKVSKFIEIVVRKSKRITQNLIEEQNEKKAA